jgi:hypothetical protein
MSNDDHGGSPDDVSPAKPVLNDDRSAESGDGESRAKAVRQDTGAIDADAAHDRSS